jgi:hypothetical protein
LHGLNERQKKGKMRDNTRIERTQESETLYFIRKDQSRKFCVKFENVLVVVQATDYQ